MNKLDFIQTVKIQGEGYLLNGNMSVPKADGNREYELIKQWLSEGNIPEPEFTEEEFLKKAKENKLIELEKAKDEEQEKPVLVRNIYFFGGRSSGQKYKEAFELAQLLGQTKGEVRAVDRMVEVDEEYIKEILVAIGTSTYQAWYKLQQLMTMIENANTTEEVNQISWNQNE